MLNRSPAVAAAYRVEKRREENHKEEWSDFSLQIVAAVGRVMAVGFSSSP